MRVLGIVGSLRAGSTNRQLLELAAGQFPDEVEFELWEGLRDIPAFDEDAETAPSAEVDAFRAAVTNADAVLIATPEYNGSIPGALKNALDWGSRPRSTSAFGNKLVAVIGASPGSFGGVWAHAETRKVLGMMGARVVDAELSLGKAPERLADPDDDLLAKLSAVFELLATAAEGPAAVAA